MRASNKVRSLDVLFIFFIFFLSNVSAFFRVIWLIPQVVIVQSILFLLSAIFALGILYKERMLETFKDSLRKNWFIFPFLIYSLFSIFWSIQQHSSLFRWIILFSTVILGGYIGLRYPLKVIIRHLSAFGLMILGLSIIFIISLPSLSIMNYSPYEGAWQGIFWHKNHMGLITSLLNFIYLIQLIENIKSRRTTKFIWGGFYLLSLIFLVKTESVGAYLTTIFIHGYFLVLFVWMKIRKSLKPKHYAFFIIMTAVSAVLVFTNLDVIFGLFGRSTSLTGRIPMWETLLDTFLVKRPYVGYGFNAFWYYPPSRTFMQSAIGWFFPPVISDNGFIDILINTGVIGLALFGIIYVILWQRSMKKLKRATSSLDLFPATFVAFTLIGNLSFSLLFETEAFIMLIMMILLFSSCQNIKESVLVRETSEQSDQKALNNAEDPSANVEKPE